MNALFRTNYRDLQTSSFWSGHGLTWATMRFEYWHTQNGSLKTPRLERIHVLTSSRLLNWQIRQVLEKRIPPPGKKLEISRCISQSLVDAPLPTTINVGCGAHERRIFWPGTSTFNIDTGGKGGHRWRQRTSPIFKFFFRGVEGLHFVRSSARAQKDGLLHTHMNPILCDTSVTTASVYVCVCLSTWVRMYVYLLNAILFARIDDYRTCKTCKPCISIALKLVQK